MRIRGAVPDRDAAACAAVYAPHVAEGHATFETEPVDAEAMRRRMRAVVARHCWLVCEDDGGAVVGYAYASPHRDRAAYRWAVDVAVYLDARHHGRGAGRALYQQLFARLRGQGVVMALAGIALPNAASVGLHEALGFALVGVYRDIGFKLGAWRDVAWYQLRLADPPPVPPGEVKPPAPEAEG